MLAATAAAMPRVSERLRIFLRSPEASPEAFDEIERQAIASGMPEANVKTLMAQLRSKINTSTNRPSSGPSGSSATTPASGPRVVDDSEEPEENAASGRTLAERRDDADIREAVMIGGGLGVLPAAAFIASTAPQLAALGGSSALSASTIFAAPAIGGAGLGYYLGKRWGHPYMGAMAGTVGGTAAGYGVLAATPTIAGGVASLDAGLTALGAANPWVVGTGLVAGGAGLGYMAGRKLIGGDYGGAIGATVGALGTATPLGLALHATGGASIATVLNPVGMTLAMGLAPTALGGYIGYQLGGRKGATVGALSGAAVGGSLWWLGANGTAATLGSISALGAPAWAPVLAGAAVPAAAVGALYLGGKVHQLVWGTPQNVGTWGMLGRAVASPITLPARALNFAHELAWGTDKAEDLGTQTLRTIASPLTVPAGLLWKRLGLGALAEGVWNGMDEAYQPKHSGIYGALEWIGSRPGQLLRGIGSAVSSIPAKGKGLMNWLFEKKSS